MINRKRAKIDEDVGIDQQINKKIKNAKKVEYNGIVFRSGLEKFCAEQLDDNKVKYGYETMTFTLMEKFTSNCPFYGYIQYTDRKTKERVKSFEITTPNIRAMTYTPDFVGNGWIIETKGMMTDSAVLKQKLFKKHLLDNDLHYIVFVPRNKTQVLETVKIIKNLATINTKFT